MKDNQLRLPNGNIITLNEQQYEAVNKIREWLDIDTEIEGEFFTLSGFAGTGKTTVVKKILDEYVGSVCVSAPTHKAKKVIIDITNKEGLTLQSLLGLRPDVSLDEFNPNKPIFSQIAIPRICQYSLIVVDEASMINKELYEMIKEQIRGRYTKVMFMGDPAQIPPVNEIESLVFTNNLNNTITLTKLERQNEDNPIIELYDIIRDNIDSPYKEYESKTMLNEKNEGVIFINNNNEFRELMIDVFKDGEFKKDIDYCRVLAWTNKTVEYTNNFIRNRLFGENADVVEVDDILMGYRHVQKNKFSNLIENSADYVVIERGKKINNKYGLNGWFVKIRENMPMKTYRYEMIFIIDIEDEKNLHNYADEHDKLLSIARVDKKVWTTYYQFRNDNILMKNITQFRDGKLRNKDEVIVKDIDYGFCLTVHKSQGSTYENVIILEDDIDKNYNVVERNRIKYVAFTRPKQKAIIFNKREL